MNTGKVTFLSDLHFDHNQWKSELLFWENEINFFDQQLAKIVQRSKAKNILAQVEHFQNVIALHQEEIKFLRHKLSRHEELLARVARLLPSRIEQKTFNDHAAIRDRFNTQRKMFRQLKNEFFLFLGEHESTKMKEKVTTINDK